MTPEMEQDMIGDHRRLLVAAEQSGAKNGGKQSSLYSGTTLPLFLTANGIFAHVEESEPSSPNAGPPANFHEVVPGIYRSSFPRLGNFEFLGTLGLKTILTLVDEEYPGENKEFVAVNGITHVQIAIPPNKNPSDVIPPHLMAMALELLLDKRYHPLLVHCNKGKHRTGCVVGCYRKMNDVPMGAIINEYRRYAGVKARILDEKFIETFDENAMYTRLDDMVLARAAQRRPLMTPPNSVKDDFKEDILSSSRSQRGNSKASDASQP
ncbi:hypothetical protein MMC26_003135 [Xylographa opegraphella]|nr:hypothetical protein [Xylographa opegraphella]